MLAAALDDVEMSVEAFRRPSQYGSVVGTYWRPPYVNDPKQSVPGVTDEKMQKAMLALWLHEGADGS